MARPIGERLEEGNELLALSDDSVFGYMLEEAESTVPYGSHEIIPEEQDQSQNFSLASQHVEGAGRLDRNTLRGLVMKAGTDGSVFGIVLPDTVLGEEGLANHSVNAAPNTRGKYGDSMSGPYEVDPQIMIELSTPRRGMGSHKTGKPAGRYIDTRNRLTRRRVSRQLHPRNRTFH